MPTCRPSGSTTQPLTTVAPRIWAVDRYSPDGFATVGNAKLHVRPFTVMVPTSRPPVLDAVKVAPAGFVRDTPLPSAVPHNQASVVPSHR
jgi:hypothetical protein